MHTQMTHPDEEAKVQLLVSLASGGELDAACSVASTISDREMACEAWRNLSRANANMQRFDAALAAIDIALQHRPESADIRLERALVMEQQGRHAESLAELAALANAGITSPQLLVHLARALQFAGRAGEAETLLESALIRWPADVPLHVQLTQLRWQRGAGEAATLSIEQAIERFPRELGLRLVAADQLRNAGFSSKALKLLEEGLALAPESTAFLTSMGVMLDGLDRPEEALRYLNAAVARQPSSAVAKRNLAATLLRVGRAAEALELCNELSARAPEDQQLIAYRATALRLLRDPEYTRLYDYARLVRTYLLRPSERFADIVHFNAALAEELLQMHRANTRPLAQSLRGGTQTERNLPANNPVIAEFFAMIDAPIQDYISRLRNHSDHPTDRRKRDEYRIVGSWSVQLAPGGFHISHVHPQGWLSSAYYVELPEDAIADDSGREGWLKFGEPGIPLTACPADHFVKPVAGMLVLFPSFMWHGTVPFTEGGRRLTAAFDIVPAG
jgi:tetratricopeptide (TPR) repeat protein